MPVSRASRRAADEAAAVGIKHGKDCLKVGIGQVKPPAAWVGGTEVAGSVEDGAQVVFGWRGGGCRGLQALQLHDLFGNGTDKDGETAS